MLQCGDPSGTGGGGPGYTYADETDPDDDLSRRHRRDGQRRAGHQRLAVLPGLRRLPLPPNYTVFGTITSGLDVLHGHRREGYHGGGPDGAPAAAGDDLDVTVDRQR